MTHLWNICWSWAFNFLYFLSLVIFVTTFFKFHWDKASASSFSKTRSELGNNLSCFLCWKKQARFKFRVPESQTAGKSEDAVRQRLGRVNVKNCVVFLFSCGPTEREKIVDIVVFIFLTQIRLNFILRLKKKGSQQLQTFELKLKRALNFRAWSLFVYLARALTEYIKNLRTFFSICWQLAEVAMIMSRWAYEKPYLFDANRGLTWVFPTFYPAHSSPN